MFRTKKYLPAALLVFLVFAVLAVALAAFFPRESKGFALSYVWWLAASPVFFAIYLTLESSGTWFLERPFWYRIPRWARILLLVAIISFVSAGIFFVGHLIDSHKVL